MAQAAHQQLIRGTVDLLGRMRQRARAMGQLDNVSKSTRLGLTSLLGEVLTEFNEQHANKLPGALKASKATLGCLQGVFDTLQEIQQFLDDVAGQSMLVFLQKNKYKRRDQALRTNLRAKATQLSSALMLVMLSQPRRGSAAVVAGGASGSVGIGLGNVIIGTDDAGASVNVKALTTAVAASTANALTDSSLGVVFSAGYSCYHGIGRAKNYSLAYSKFLEAAELGDSDSMAMVGTCYNYGQGVEKDLTQARLWFSRGAASGSNRAKTELALLLLNDLPEKTKPSSKVGSRLLLQEDKERDSKGFSRADESSMRAGFPQRSNVSSERDDVDGNGDVGDGGSSSSSGEKRSYDWAIGEALRLLLEAASECHTEAQAQLASFNETSGNYVDALKWYQLAANDGCPGGLVGLGRLYLYGLGVQQNTSTALSHFVAAGRAGNADGYYFAGVACEKGIAPKGSDASSPSPNMQEALRYYHLAADGGVREAMFAYGYTLLREAIGMVSGLPEAARVTMSVQERDVYETKASEGIRYLRNACELGVVDAGFQLGRCYEQGIGVARDEQSAFGQFKAAAAKGHANAALCAANLLFTGFHSGMPSPLEVQQSVKYYLQAAELGNAAAVNCLGLLCEDGRVDAESIATLYPLPGSLNLEETGSLDLANDSVASAAMQRHNQLKMAAMLYHHSLLLENGDAALNLALLLSGGDVSSFVSHAAQLVTAQDGLYLLKSVVVNGPGRAQYQRLLQKIENVVIVLVSQVSHFEREAWEKRFPRSVVPAVSAFDSTSRSGERPEKSSRPSTVPPKESRWGILKSFVSKSSSSSSSTTPVLPTKPAKTPKREPAEESKIDVSATPVAPPKPQRTPTTAQ